MKKLGNWGLMLAVLLLSNCGNDAQTAAKAKEQACGKTTCQVPPLAENADADLKNALEKMNGKWNLLSIRQRYTATNQETYFTAAQLGATKTFCFGNTGGIALTAGKEQLCNYCYTLEKTPENGIKMVVDSMGVSKFCAGQISSGNIEFSADSLIINVKEPLITKRFLLYRQKEYK